MNDNIKIRVAFSISDNYSPHLAATLASILANAGIEDKLEIFIVSSGDISPENREKIASLSAIKSFELHFRDCDSSVLSRLSGGGCHISTNYRLMSASLFADMDKIVFLDVDLIVLKSLRQLWLNDICKYYFAAAPDPCTCAFLDYVDAIRDNFERIPYNTGVMLMNLDKWREENLEQRIFEKLAWYSTLYTRTPDQNVLNILCKDHILPLNPRYGACPTLAFVQDDPWNYDRGRERKYVFDEPYILHFASRRELKPWLKPELPYADYYWKYLKMTPFYEQIKDSLSMTNAGA